MSEPIKLTPYNPSAEMREAMKRIDPALTHEQCRALWSAAWSASMSPSPQPADSDDQDAKWRDVALRFDKHRMSALWHLQAMLKDPARHAEVVRKFLSDPTHPDVRPAVEPMTREQMIAAVRPLCSAEANAEKLVDFSMDEYRAIEAHHGITAKAEGGA